jgi:hypothetical protein
VPVRVRVENTLAGMETSLAPLSIVKLSEILPLMTTGTCNVPCARMSGIDSECAARPESSAANKATADNMFSLAMRKFVVPCLQSLLPIRFYLRCQIILAIGVRTDRQAHLARGGIGEFLRLSIGS